MPLYAEVERDGHSVRRQEERAVRQVRQAPRPDADAIPRGAVGEIAKDLETPIVARDPRLQLRGLTVKGDIDLEWDIRLAQNDWEQVRQLAASWLTAPGRIVRPVSLG